jgi:small subunit ribosomal protein S8
MMTDPIADMLTRIRNANSIKRKQTSMPASKLKVAVAQALKEEGFISDYAVEAGSPRSTLTVTLRYGPDGQSVIRTIERISKPGRRVYSGSGKLPRVVRGQGIFVLSTPRGVLSDRVARRERVGGEVLCKVF